MIGVRHRLSGCTLPIFLGLAIVSVGPTQAASNATTDNKQPSKAILVKPGESIQAAIDRAAPGTQILISPGVYKERTNVTNGLNITKSGLKLIGLVNHNESVVLENAGDQRNGIVAVPPSRTDCMSCHTDLAPPFQLKPEFDSATVHPEPMLEGIEIRNITIKGFNNNGLFAELLNNFKIDNVHSVKNPNYGIFPTRSSNGVISNSSAIGADDSGIWIETSNNITASHNLVANNVNGFEISNSNDVVLSNNESTGNTVGIAALLLPDIYNVHPGAKRLILQNNYIHDNNRVNTARDQSILGTVPSGVGILQIGQDDALITNNRIENNNFFGIALADYCVVVNGTPFACGVDPDTINQGFLADQTALNNKIRGNFLLNNGSSPEKDHPFKFAASDIALVTDKDGVTNCFSNNKFSTSFSSLGFLPVCIQSSK